ncbi:MAG: bifunctional DNA-formamidopyrimidine glycosylase/DNA-(apurinic or apyrimidinic site) lyase [Bryobacteraceae bacterium]
MPELPEVETVVRSITRHLVGKRILSASFSSNRVTRGDHVTTSRALAGSTVMDVERLGKQIWICLDRGFLYVHLGMTGKLLWNGSPGKYTRAFLQLTDGHLLFDDIRTFGRFEFFPEKETALAPVGPDALTVSFEEFFRRLGERRGRIKAVLLSQSFLAGVGNIYADEALFSAGIHPRTPVQRVSQSRARRLHSATLEILSTAITHKGSSISDYVDGLGERGSFQQLHKVYGRAGEPCPNCGAKIRRIVVGQRGTHYCPRCQRV